MYILPNPNEGLIEIIKIKSIPDMIMNHTSHTYFKFRLTLWYGIYDCYQDVNM